MLPASQLQDCSSCSWDYKLSHGQRSKPDTRRLRRLTAAFAFCNDLYADTSNVFWITTAPDCAAASEARARSTSAGLVLHSSPRLLSWSRSLLINPARTAYPSRQTEPFAGSGAVASAS